MKREKIMEEKRKELRLEFEKETGAHPFADQKYIQWLEQKLVSRTDHA